MFKNKNKLMYYFKDDKFNNKEFSKEMIDRFLIPSGAKSSCWWSTLKPTLFGLDMSKTIIEFHNKYLSGGSSGSTNLEYQNVSTARKCPALINMFSNSYLMRSPADMTITIDKSGSFISHASNDLIEVTTHPIDQFYTETNNLFEGKMNLKFMFPYYLKSDIQWMFLQPMYHNNMWFTVANGAIFGKYLAGQGINLNVFVDIPKEEPITYEIKEGDILSYLWFPEKVKLEYSNVKFADTLIQKNWSSKSMY